MSRHATITIIALWALTAVAAPALAQDEEQGRQVYDQNCASCHQSEGAGLPPTFPPLAGNERAGDADYVENVIRNGQQGPIEVDGITYDGQMPAFAQLSDDEIASVVLYVQGLAGAQPDTTSTTAAPPSEGGEAANGESIFRGAVRLSEGGAACYSCHQAGTYRQGGAGLGPDLTDAYSRLGGEPGLTAWLSNPPSQTMQGIYADRPLTDGEIADLVAFLATTDGIEIEAGVDGFLLGGLGGLVALLGIVAFAIRGPSRSYVDRLRSRR